MGQTVFLEKTPKRTQNMAPKQPFSAGQKNTLAFFRDFAETNPHKPIPIGANTKGYKREGKVTLLESI